MSPRFIFLRHGEAEHNVAFHKEGASVFKEEAYRDAKLTAKGIEQAIEAAKALSSLKIKAIWSSPLTRCIQTAEEVFEEVDCDELYLHDNLLERLGNGHLMNERKQKSILKKEFPIWKRDYLPDLPAFWAEYENTYALRQRMCMLVMLLSDIYKDEENDSHILLVGHSDAIQSLTGHHLNNAEYKVMTLSEILS